MRKAGVILCIFLLLSALVGTVYAAEASAMNATANVSADGKAQVSMTLTLHLDGTVDKLYFPLPVGASGVRVNGSRVSGAKDGDVLNINLARFVKGVTGDVSVNIQYDLHGLVTETEIGTLELQLPLLSGFSYPINDLQFTVTLPGAVKTLPAFTSGYHQSAIEQHLSYTVEGTTVSGNSLKAMKDHETLLMTLPVDDTMFSRVVVQTESALVAWWGWGICAGLALVYWLVFLRAFPLRQRCTEPPEGFHAGQLGCILGSGGIDLSMMVLTWAQLGYILIQPDRRGKVLLHKRMDMGNERSDGEVRAFRELFGSRIMIDATGSRYANLAVNLRRKRMGISELLHRRSGNPFVFRILCAGMGLFAGGGIGAVMGDGAALQWFMIFALGALGAFSGYRIAIWTDSGLFRRKRTLVTGLGLSLLWVILSLAAGCFGLGIAMVLSLLLYGFLYGLAGLRTELGKRTAGQILGLRHYLRGSDKQQLQRACQGDPDYFFHLIPYAMALGVGKAFAKAVGREKLERCPYLTSGMDGHMSAIGWHETLAATVEAMDARMENRHMEKLIKTIRSITRP